MRGLRRPFSFVGAPPEVETDMAINCANWADDASVKQWSTLDGWNGVEPRQRRLFCQYLWRISSLACREAEEAGELDDGSTIDEQIAAVTACVERRARQARRYGSILTMIALALLVEIIKAIIRKIIENRTG